MDIEFIKREWARTQEAILDVVQLVTLPTQWPAARAKILRFTNNFLRTLENGQKKENS